MRLIHEITRWAAAGLRRSMQRGCMTICMAAGRLDTHDSTCGRRGRGGGGGRRLLDSLLFCPQLALKLSIAGLQKHPDNLTLKTLKAVGLERTGKLEEAVQVAAGRDSRQAAI